MLAVVRKWLLILLFVSLGGFLLVRGYQFRLHRDQLPLGTEIAGIDVSGMTTVEAKVRIADAYSRPLYLYHLEEHVEVDPVNVGFDLDMDGMFAAVDAEFDSQGEWLAFASFALERPVRPVSVALRASHSPAELRATIESIAAFLDSPPSSPSILVSDAVMDVEQHGYVTDVTASMAPAEEALYSLESRAAELVVVEQQAPEFDLDLLAKSIETKLQAFNGLGSVFIMDLESGEEVGINTDVALSGLSILKIAIFVEAYRALDGDPDAFQQQLFLDTATRSSNFSANLLLHVVAGEDNTYRGADILTESMRRLGLVNTFMAIPYDASPPAYRQTTYTTPANSRLDSSSQPDPTMQSTAEEIGTLLAMIYQCSRGGGALLAVYPQELTAAECQSILDLMLLNEEGNLIRFGVPQGTPVSHKHGWALGTHADAGVVFSPGGNYVLVEYLHVPGTWLVAEESFPILREISRATYNYFNMEEPYLGNPLGERGVVDAVDPFSENQGSAEVEEP